MTRSRHLRGIRTPKWFSHSVPLHRALPLSPVTRENASLQLLCLGGNGTSRNERWESRPWAEAGMDLSTQLGVRRQVLGLVFIFHND